MIIPYMETMGSLDPTFEDETFLQKDMNFHFQFSQMLIVDVPSQFTINLRHVSLHGVRTMTFRSTLPGDAWRVGCGKTSENTT